MFSDGIEKDMAWHGLRHTLWQSDMARKRDIILIYAKLVSPWNEILCLTPRYEIMKSAFRELLSKKGTIRFEKSSKNEKNMSPKTENKLFSLL